MLFGSKLLEFAEFGGCGRADFWGLGGLLTFLARVVASRLGMRSLGGVFRGLRERVE